MQMSKSREPVQQCSSGQRLEVPMKTTDSDPLEERRIKSQPALEMKDILHLEDNS